MYVMKSDLDPVQMTKISSMNRFHINMFGLPISISSISNFPINRFAYAGAILYPLLFLGFVDNIVEFEYVIFYDHVY